MFIIVLSIYDKPLRVAKCDFPTHAVDEAFVDSGTMMEGTHGAFGGQYGPTARPSHPIVLGPTAI